MAMVPVSGSHEMPALVDSTASTTLAIQDRAETLTSTRSGQPPSKALALRDWNDEHRNADDSRFMQSTTVRDSKAVGNRGFDQLAGNPRQRAQKAMMEADAIEDALFGSVRTTFTVDKADSHVMEKIRKARRFVYCFTVCASIWVVLCAGCLISLPMLYWHVTVGLTRERFILSVAERVGAQATGSFSMALAARDAVHYAVQRKLYFEPSDYATVRTVLEPLFTAQPTLRAVELTFLGRNGSDEALVVRSDQSIIVRRLLASSEQGGAPGLLVQTDAPGCVEALGTAGCIVGVPASRQDWVADAAALPCGQEQCEGIGERGGLGNSKWLDTPGFVPWDGVEQPRPGKADASDSEVHWAPAYSMVFRSVFPGSGGNLSVVGRATLDISRLSQDINLNLGALGAEGGVYLCNRRGVILSAASPERTCKPDAISGLVYFRKAWELGPEWAAQLTPGDFANGRRFSVGAVEVIVEPLKRSRMDHFTVLVAAERSGFADGQAMSLSVWCQVLSYLPLGVVFLFMMSLYVNQKYQKIERESVTERLSLSRLSRDLSSFKPRWSLPRGSSIMSTIRNSSLSFRSRRSSESSLDSLYSE